VDGYVGLDIIGAMEGTDKSSCVGKAWDYLRHYEAALKDLQHEKINLIEIGVQNGNSTRVWKWFFSQANIIGIDINPACARWAQDRVKIEIGSQTDGKFLDRVCHDHPPTVIIDDGSHMSEHIIFTFERAFPQLLPGGYYIIEDFGGQPIPPAKSKTPDAASYFLELARCCHGGQLFKSNQKFTKAILDQVDSITLFKRAALVRKKHAARDVPKAVAIAEAYLGEQQRLAGARDRLAAYVVRHGGPPDLAENILQASIEADKPSALRLLLRAENLARVGKTAEAAAVLKQAAECPPGLHLVMLRMATLQSSLGDLEGALQIARQAARQRPKHYAKRVAALEQQLAARNRPPAPQ